MSFWKLMKNGAGGRCVGDAVGAAEHEPTPTTSGDARPTNVGIRRDRCCRWRFGRDGPGRCRRGATGGKRRQTASCFGGGRLVPFWQGRFHAPGTARVPWRSQTNWQHRSFFGFDWWWGPIPSAKPVSVSARRPRTPARSHRTQDCRQLLRLPATPKHRRASRTSKRGVAALNLPSAGRLRAGAIRSRGSQEDPSRGRADLRHRPGACRSNAVRSPFQLSPSVPHRK